MEANKNKAPGFNLGVLSFLDINPFTVSDLPLPDPCWKIFLGGAARRLPALRSSNSRARDFSSRLRAKEFEWPLLCFHFVRLSFPYRLCLVSSSAKLPSRRLSCRL